ncbi:inositol monophosphatase family protein [Naumannella halotolerans]|uniref:inositol-phosphate phosphatase n=1 Tax=Naumannella halotolerans TaxID=993414 RepID=A0A4R7JB66_9ACTN|nr:inositol monophosphatase [Naumannella halotolerans]TDT33897.1 fructose-1,6-bisphosphatase/inositol monophosphatase family enzyme [Naumannella halotolerans]
MPDLTLPNDASTEGILHLMQQVAEKFITPRFRQLQSDEVFEKGPGDLVTVADRESEAALTEALQQLAPDALIVGEEAVAADPGLLEQLAGADHAYLVDPLDGTKNFVRGSDDHAVLVAELRDSEAVRGWIWQPQHGLALTAEQGRGVLRNGEPVGPSAPHHPPVLASSSARRLESPDYRLVWARGCCGVDYPDLVDGTFDLLAYAHPKPWDHAAGVLMARELGGDGRYLDGEPYRAGRPAPRGNPLTVSAHPALLGLLAGHR